MSALTVGLSLPLSDAAGGVPYQSKGITVAPGSPAPGGHATVTAKGFRPGSDVTVLISAAKHEPFLKLGKPRADADGVAVDHVVIPKGSSFVGGSSHVVEAQGVEVGGHSLTVSTTVTLSAPVKHSIH